MKTAAIIAEFNPLHKGHEYIINEAKKATGADSIVIVMSGNFVQRGTPAISDKYSRAFLAVKSGADMVIELPAVYATSSAEGFAMGAVRIINALGFVDYLVFGSESGDILSLGEAARFFAHEPDVFKKKLQELLSQGLSYPEARERAYSAAGGRADISSPNNILAIEYIKALILTSSPIVPVTIKRRGSSYLDKEYNPDAGFISATAFRNCIKGMDSSQAHSLFSDTLPAASCKLYDSLFSKSFPVCDDDIMHCLSYALLTKRNRLNSFSDFNEQLKNRFVRLYEELGISLFSKGYEGLILELKTRELTATRIQRALLHALLDITDEIAAMSYDMDCPYIRLLALNDMGRTLLKQNKKTIDAVVINRLGKSMDKLNHCRPIIDADIRASEVYSLMVLNKFGHALKDEFRQETILI